MTRSSVSYIGTVYASPTAPFHSGGEQGTKLNQTWSGPAGSPARSCSSSAPSPLPHGGGTRRFWRAVLYKTAIQNRFSVESAAATYAPRGGRRTVEDRLQDDAQQLLRPLGDRLRVHDVEPAVSVTVMASLV
jgi:hypothetical protein